MEDKNCLYVYIMILLFLIAGTLNINLWGSYSIRTPRIENNPTDWEVRAGCKFEQRGRYFYIERMIEFENGKRYNGLDGRFESEIFDFDRYGYLKAGAKNFIKTAKEISDQEVYGLFSFKVGKFSIGAGSSLMWDDYIDKTTGLKTQVKGKIRKKIKFIDYICTLLAEYTTDFEERSRQFYEIDNSFTFFKPFTIRAFGKYKKSKDKEWFQAKIVPGIKFVITWR